MTSPFLQCSQCGHVGPQDDFTELAEDEVSQIISDDMESGNIGSPGDYEDMIGLAACPECRSVKLDCS